MELAYKRVQLYPAFLSFHDQLSPLTNYVRKASLDFMQVRLMPNAATAIIGHGLGGSHMHPPPNLRTNTFLNPYDALITNQNVNIA